MTIADTIRNNDFEEYQRLRYLGDYPISDGEELVLENEDFTGVNFDKFAMGFAKFINCTLDEASRLYGQPITIENCSAKDIDMRSIRTIIFARNTNFTGMKYDEDTRLSYGESEEDTASVFINCTVDDEAREHLSKQGVVFKTDKESKDHSK